MHNMQNVSGASSKDCATEVLASTLTTLLFIAKEMADSQSSSDAEEGR